MPRQQFERVACLYLTLFNDPKVKSCALTLEEHLHHVGSTEFCRKLGTRHTGFGYNEPGPTNSKLIPDAYRYFMAREIVRLQANGYRLKDLERKVAEAHHKYKSYRGKFLLSLAVENTSGKYLFLRRGERHLALRRKSSTSPFKVIEQVPKLRYEAWKIYESRRSTSRTEFLAEFDEQRILLLVSKFDLESNEPFTLTFRNVVAHEKTDEVAGFNDHSRQMSIDQFRDLLVPEVSFLVSPARVKHAQPPHGFDELLSGLK